MAHLMLAVDITNTAGDAANLLTGNWQLLAAGIILIVIAALLVMIVKRIVVNSILGILCWALLYFVLKVELQLIPTLVVSLIFGLAGVGVILLLKFLGVPV
jgi:hypothetical protein